MYGSTSHRANKDIIRTCQVTQLGPVSPSPVTLVMVPSRVLITGMEGRVVGASDIVGVSAEVDIEI